MKKKVIALGCLVILIAGAAIFFLNANEQPADDRFGWAVFHRQDGEYTIRYDASATNNGRITKMPLT